MRTVSHVDVSLMYSWEEVRSTPSYSAILIGVPFDILSDLTTWSHNDLSSEDRPEYCCLVQRGNEITLV